MSGPAEPVPERNPDPLDVLRTKIVLGSGLHTWNAEETPPESVAHYTDAAGALGILHDQQLWATHALFMNDASELTFADPIFKDALATVARQHRSNDLLRRFVTASEAAYSQEETDPGIYVVCFCEDGDLLSQWRGYSTSGGGYSLGFDADALSTDAARCYGLQFLKVIYDPDQQRQIATDIINTSIRALAEHINDHQGSHDQAIAVAAPALVQAARRFAYQVKDPAFSEEAEWRLIYTRETPSFLPTYDLRFRASARGILPYVQIHIVPPPEKPTGVRLNLNLTGLPLRTVTVGPTAHPGTSTLSMEYLLADLGVRNVIVQRSQIPLRA